MASRFWVGGTGNWDASDTTHWSATSGGAGGASVPGTSDAVIFDGSSGGGTVTVTAAVSVISITGGAFTGTLDTNGQTIATSNNFSFSGTGVRTLTLGTSTINISGQWILTTTTNLTFSGASSTINVPSVTGNAFSGGGKTYGTVSITVTSSNGGPILAGANTFTNLTITGAASKTPDLWISADQIITGTLTINGNSATNRILIKSSTIGTPRTLTAATVSVTNADFQDITGAGAGSWNLSAITGLSGDCGGNSGITFTTPTNQHWTNASSGNWSDSTNWTSRVPLPQDDVFMDKAFGTAQTVTADMPRLGKSIDWTGATWTTSLTWATASSTLTIFGSLILIDNPGVITITGTAQFTFSGRSSYVLTAPSYTFEKFIELDAPNGTLTLNSNLTLGTSRRLTITNGTFTCVDGGNNYVISSGSIRANTGTITLGSATHLITGTDGGFPWAGTSTVTAFTGTIKFTDTSNTAITFTGGGRIYNNVWFSRGASTGSITISGSNTFSDFKDDGTTAHSILFTTGTTQTVTTFSVSGTVGSEITINSTTTGTHALVKSGGGTISCDYLNIQHSVATPSSTWYAGANSTNNQATATAGSGWIFTVPPAVINSPLSVVNILAQVPVANSQVNPSFATINMQGLIPTTNSVITAVLATINILAETPIVNFIISTATGLINILGNIPALRGLDIWHNQSKNSSSASNLSKNTSVMINVAKNTAVMTNLSKNNASPNNQSKSNSSWTNQSKS